MPSVPLFSILFPIGILKPLPKRFHRANRTFEAGKID
jgi:hypothetical protein